MKKKIFNKKEFSMMIEREAIEKNCTYIDAIVDYCEKNNVEIEVIAKLLNPKIKKSIESEAMDSNMLKERVSKLEI